MLIKKIFRLKICLSYKIYQDFATIKSLYIFDAYGIELKFLKNNPDTGEKDTEFIVTQKITIN